MSTLVFCVFDLNHATREDYLYAYMDLADAGLRQTVKSETARASELPASAVMGVDGRSVDDIRSTLSEGAGIFKSRGLKGTFFLVASGDWPAQARRRKPVR
jgi:hypothetical protein